jgi:hypothetical protein
MSAHELDFFYRKMPVGFFQEAGFPKAPGRYRYMPYRGAGHYELGQALRRGEHCECASHAVNPLVTFRAVAIPAYGEIELDDFQIRHTR